MFIGAKKNHTLKLCFYLRTSTIWGYRTINAK